MFVNFLVFDCIFELSKELSNFLFPLKLICFILVILPSLKFKKRSAELFSKLVVSTKILILL